MKPPRLPLTSRSGPAAEAASQATPPCQGPPAHPLGRQPAHFKPATPAPRTATAWRRGPQRAPARPGPRLDENEPNLEEPDTSTRLAKSTQTPGQADPHGQGHGQGDGNEPQSPPAAATAPGLHRHAGADDAPLAPHDATPGRANVRQFTEEVLALLNQSCDPPCGTLQQALLRAVQAVLGRIDPAAQAGGLAAVRSLLIDIPRTPRPHPAGTRGTDLHGLLPLLLLNLQRQRTPQQTQQAQTRLHVLARGGSR